MAGRRTLVIALSIAIAVFSFGYRYLSFGLTDDDLLHFVTGRQIQQFGEWPVRDLVEEGDPLHDVISAGLQSMFGYRLAGEVFFDLAMLSIAAALTFVLATTVSGSIGIACAVTLLVVLFGERLNDYPKAFVLAGGLWLCFRYVDRPVRIRAALLGAATGMAFLLRHDLGVYLGIASVAVLVPQAARSTVAAAGIDLYAIAVAACVIPFLIYVQIYQGVPAYVAAAGRFTQREVARDRDPRPAMVFDFNRGLWERSPGVPVKIRWATELEPGLRTEVERRYRLEDGQREEGRTWRYTLHERRPENLRALVLDPQIEDTANIDRTVTASVDESSVRKLRRALRRPPAIALAPGVLTLNNAVAWLYDLFVALPYLVLLSLGVTRLRGKTMPAVWAKLLPVAIVAAIAAPLWLRGNLYRSTRLADLTVPAAVLGAFFLARALRPRSRRLVTACAATLGVAAYIVTAGSIVAFAQVKRGVDDALIIFDAETRQTDLDRKWNELWASPPSLEWVSRETGMRGAVEYLRRCTAADDRVLVYGFYPEVLFFSGRGSAVDRGVVLRGFWTQPHEQQRTIAKMQRASAPVVLIDVQAAGTLDSGRVIDPTLPLLDRYLAQHYVSAGVTGFGASTGASFNVLVDRRRTPAGTYPPFSLPCFVPGA